MTIQEICNMCSKFSIVITTGIYIVRVGEKKAEKVAVW